MLNGNEIGPRSMFQLVFISFILLAGALINANIFGNMAVIIQDLNKKVGRFLEKIDTANTAMMNMNLPTDIKKKVINYLMQTQSNLESQEEMEIFYQMIPPSLKLEVTKHIFSKVVTRNSVFSEENGPMLEFVMVNIRMHQHNPEENIVQHKDPAHALFFLTKGEGEVRIKDQSGIEYVERILKAGAIFGEVGLLAKCTRTATVRALNYCSCATL